MAKFSKKVMGKEVDQAAVYAEPHDMNGKAIKATPSKDESGAKCMTDMNISVAGISKGNYSEPKTTGIKIRGTGAATKGLMARGPMG